MTTTTQQEQGGDGGEPLSSRLQRKCDRHKYDVVDEYWGDRVDQPRRESTVCTHLTIRGYRAWMGTYPYLRELLQNVMDYLELIDATGFRDKEVRVRHEGGGAIHFVDARGVDLLRIGWEGDDKMVLHQRFTFPLSTDALCDGVVDPDKQRAGCHAGGFGVGFKDAARAILHRDGRLTWVFTTEEERITWKFVAKAPGRRRSHLESFATLQVKTTAMKLRQPAATNERYTMTQVVEMDGVRSGFFTTVVPRMSLFWEAPSAEARRLTLGEDSLVARPPVERAIVEAAAVHDAADPPATVEGGVYVLGIYVCELTGGPPQAVYMAGAGSRVRVQSRDRNSVAQDAVLVGIRRMVDHAAPDPPLLRPLLYTTDDDDNDEGLDGDGSEAPPPLETWLAGGPRAAYLEQFWTRVFAPDGVGALHKFLGWAPGTKVVVQEEEEGDVSTPSSPPPLASLASALGIDVRMVGARASASLFPRTSPQELTQAVASKLRDVAQDSPSAPMLHFASGFLSRCHGTWEVRLAAQRELCSPVEVLSPRPRQVVIVVQREASVLPRHLQWIFPALIRLLDDGFTAADQIADAYRRLQALPANSPVLSVSSLFEDAAAETEEEVEEVDEEEEVDEVDEVNEEEATVPEGVPVHGVPVSLRPFPSSPLLSDVGAEIAAAVAEVLGKRSREEQDRFLRRTSSRAT